MRESDLNATQFCRFLATSASGSVVLELKYWEAKIRLNDNLVRLNVEEKTVTSVWGTYCDM
jgi:hypothetical protein